MRCTLPPTSSRNCSQVSDSLKLSKAVLPSSTETTATSPGTCGTPSRLCRGERTTSRPSARRPNSDRWLTRRGVDLEGVGRGDPAVAEDRRTEQQHRGVDREPEPHRGQVVRLRVDQLEVDEREEPQRRRPQTHPGGEVGDPGVRVAAGGAREQPVDGADRVHRGVDRAEEQRGGHQPHPQDHEDEDEGRVDRGVGSGHGRPAHVAGDRQPQDPQRPRRDPVGTERAVEALGELDASAGGVVARLAPRQRQHHEGDAERRSGTCERVLEGQRAGPARRRPRGRRPSLRPLSSSPRVLVLAAPPGEHSARVVVSL